MHLLPHSTHKAAMGTTLSIFTVSDSCARTLALCMASPYHIRDRDHRHAQEWKESRYFTSDLKIWVLISPSCSLSGRVWPAGLVPMFLELVLLGSLAIGLHE